MIKDIGRALRPAKFAEKAYLFTHRLSRFLSKALLVLIIIGAGVVIFGASLSLGGIIDFAVQPEEAGVHRAVTYNELITTLLFAILIVFYALNIFRRAPSNR
ncbi:MAG: hypothetical protein M3410_04115 [Acidobacteriota bacterium]|nr:hypothetical protein [Acidobacteriota bacterium]